jgi:3-oxoacyl-[acyl-carrier-protein] synthase-3
MMGVRILSTGGYVPKQVVSNDDLQRRLGLPAAALYRQTGIRERRHAATHQATSDLCVEAGRQCLERAGVSPRDVDSLIVATVTPDMTFPATACLVQDRLGLRCQAMDLGAACAGFVYALVTAASQVASGMNDLVLIIGGETLSRFVNPEDMKTYPLFGDGAGAALVGRGGPDQGLIRCTLGSDGSGGMFLHRKAGGSRGALTPEALQAGEQFASMDGRAVFSWAVGTLCDTVKQVLDAAGIGPGDVDLYIPHQANIRIINAALDVLGIPRGHVITNIERYGNTSAASVPLALDEAVQDDRIRQGDRIVLSGFGAGLTWGTALWQW